MKTRLFTVSAFLVSMALLALILLAGSMYATAQGAGITERVSVASDGTQGNGNSTLASISTDGRYVAFGSDASNLVSGDTNGGRDIFVHDRQTGQTTCVSVASDGISQSGMTQGPSISADGRYVAFDSDASNLVSGDTNNFCDNDADGQNDDNCYDIFVHDRQMGQTTRVSVASDGTQGNHMSHSPSISADGRYVAFYSWASNLVSGDTNGAMDIFVHDQQTGQTSRVSVASDGTQGNFGADAPSISADGRCVAFYSWASNLVSGDTNSDRDVFVHDRQTGQSSRVSVASDGTQGNGDSEASSISADSRYVAFDSRASNLVSSDTNGIRDIFVHDRQTGQTTRVSVASDGTQGNHDSHNPSISADGRYVAFESLASNLVSGDTNGTSDVFVHDQQTGQTSRVSVASDGTQGNRHSWRPSISADGRYVAFDSNSSSLVGGDTNGAIDVFVHDQEGGGDTTPPAAITDLAASTGSNPGQVNLTWTAPGDDGNIGTAMTYTVRYADSAIASEFGWAAATDVDGEPMPQIADSSESMTVSGLTPGQTYYFAIKTQDEVPNTSGLSNSPGAMAKESPLWTLMFYMDGDNNLDSNYVAAFNQLESAANNPNVNILVAWDRSANGNSAYYLVQHDTDLNETNPAIDYTDDVNRWPKPEDTNELRMNNSVTLSDFIQWARANYPAQYYALVISDHGTGLGGLARDARSGNDWLTVREWGNALATATSDGTDKIDVVFADACLMAMIEDTYQIRNYTDYYVASENTIWITVRVTSGPYDDYMSSIGATTSPHDLATIFANRYADWLNADYTDLPYTISAVDLGQLTPLVSAVNTLASSLNTQMGTYGSQVASARTAMQKFDTSSPPNVIDQNDNYVDLYDFAQKVQSNVPDATIQNAAQDVMDAITSHVIINTNHTGSYEGIEWNLDDSHGVSIFFPTKRSSFYNPTNYEFVDDVNWLGSQSTSIEAQASEIEWGSMLVTYFNVTQPGGSDTPEPPPLVSPLAPEGSNVYLPIILKN